MGLYVALLLGRGPLLPLSDLTIIRRIHGTAVSLPYIAEWTPAPLHKRALGVFVQDLTRR